MPEVEVTLLAATPFDSTRCCIAGIDPQGNWVRPGIEGTELGTRQGTRLVLVDHLWSDTSFIGGSLSVLSIGLETPSRRVLPHVEDAQMTSRPRFVRVIAREKDRIHFLDDHVENTALPPVKDERDLAAKIADLKRSLILVGPLRVREATFGILPGMHGVEKYRARLWFKLPRQKTEVDLSCTDLSWRAIGRALGAEDNAVTLSGETLTKALSVRADLYVALGLTRGTPYAMAVGVHTIPAFSTVMTESGVVRVKVSARNL